MTAFNIGDKVRFTDAVVSRLGHDAECANALGTVVGWCGLRAVKVEFGSTWIAREEDGSTVRTVPRRNLERVRPA
jgi:hypothetical protein